VEAPDQENLDEVKHIVGSHLEQFGRRDDLVVDWPEGSTEASESDVPQPGPLGDERVEATLSRIEAEQENVDAVLRERGVRHPSVDSDPALHVEAGYSLSPEQGELLYLWARSLGATRVVDFATSIGVSAIYLAAAIRDNGGGIVVGSELVPQKAEAANANLAEAGLSEFVEVRVGDARETLGGVGGPVDLAVIDGWPGGKPTLSMSVLELIIPQLRPGAMLLNDNGEQDYLEHVRDPRNGFRSATLRLPYPTEVSVFGGRLPGMSG
jgi:predicted O-methyltransferase YrrM